LLFHRRTVRRITKEIDGRDKRHLWRRMLTVWLKRTGSAVNYHCSLLPLEMKLTSSRCTNKRMLGMPVLHTEVQQTYRAVCTTYALNSEGNLRNTHLESLSVKVLPRTTSPLRQLGELSKLCAAPVTVQLKT
jgi:hypothetical protein